MIVGFGHNAQVGKDTASQALCRELGYRKVAFADKLRELAMEADPIVQTGVRQVNVNIGRGRLKHVISGLGYEEAKRLYPEVRKFLKDLGLGARKVFGEDFWVEQALAGIPAGAKVVFSDVRFPNEAEVIKEKGGLLIKITRPGHRVTDTHLSETALQDFEGWDHVIHNGGSIPELEQKVVQIVREALPVEVDA